MGCRETGHGGFIAQRGLRGALAAPGPLVAPSGSVTGDWSGRIVRVTTIVHSQCRPELSKFTHSESRALPYREDTSGDQSLARDLVGLTG